MEEEKGTSANNQCNHVPADSARTRLSWSLLSEDAGRCVGCRREDAKGRRYRKHRPAESSILMCLECGQHLCCGVGGIEYPFGHSRAHAMKKRHWVAALYDDAEKGYCFNCNAEVGMPVEFEVDGHVIGIDVIRNVVRWLPEHLPQPLPGPHTRPRMEGTSSNRCNQAEGPGFGSGLLSLGDTQHSLEFGSAIGQDYAIKGIPNISNTCYMNAIVQCLLALDKLRARMLAWDAPNSLFGMILKELVVQTGSSGGMLDPQELFTLIETRKGFKPGKMEDSHELLVSLRDILNEDEKDDDRQSGGPTVMGSIFKIELSESLSCKCGFSKLLRHSSVYDLALALPSKGCPTKSAAPPQTSESPKSRENKIRVQLFPANEHSSMENIQTVAESGDSGFLSSELKELTVEETPEPLEVDSTELHRICQSKDVVQDPLQIQKNKVSSFEFSQRIINVPVKSVNFLPHIVSDVKVEEKNEMEADSIVSIEDCLSLFSKHETEWLCDNCENDKQMTGNANEGTSVIRDQTELSDRTTCQNEQSSEPSTSDGIQTCLLKKLPPVLTLHLWRAGTPHNFNLKNSEDVRFEEYLDVGRFMDPSSVDKDNSLYRLAAVVQHHGSESLDKGHYVAYVRARRLRNQQQQSSSSSSWFCADDGNISGITLEEVLKREAYILFYERVEG